MNVTGTFFDEQIMYLYTQVVNNYMPEFVKGFVYTPWVFSMLGSVVIGLSGILPLIIISSGENIDKAGYSDRKFISILNIYLIKK